MGVPKFFRWLSERYPCLCEELKEYQIPEFDNLYLDMNGIIHVCSHPNDFDPHFRISEEKIFSDIFHNIEVLFRLIRPKKLFFMAVDGVAPRAKMNQQRGRRFSSAKEAETLEKKAIEKGESLPKEKRFDSNCITPGTKFMAKLQEQLKYFVANKISNDKLWQKPTIILSGHSVPGEGEHKIMDYIRYLRSEDGWDPHTRHCLYGLDADLIILGLCTHEPNFSLLREEVKFVKQNKRMATPETTNYVLLHLSLLRGYLDLEFGSLKDKLPFEYNIESIIDDWVLLGFLVGNDFIPHLPHLHIHCNALSILYDAYKNILPKLDGYINESGVLNLPRFEKFLTQLSQFDVDSFTETYADMKYFESKTGRKLFPELKVDECLLIEDGGRKVKMDEAALQALIKSTELEMDGCLLTEDGGQKVKTDEGVLEDMIQPSVLEIFDFDDDGANCELDEALEADGLDTINLEEDEGEGGRLFFREFDQHKRHYYLEKMKYPSVSKEVLKREAEGYVTALQWILFYYYRGCPSWSWYYPHHYSPYVSDLKGFSSLQIEFNPSTPFLPFQQLLAVLPAASKEFLPKDYQNLMTAEQSPIIDYYPKEFKFDLNGKRQEWEAVVLIPFIDEKRLLAAMEPYNDALTPKEIKRNSHGPMQIFTYSSKSLGAYNAPKYFPKIDSNHAKCREMYPQGVAVPVERLITGRHPSIPLNDSLYVQGFPVLSALGITGNLEKRGVKVFEHASRSESMILRLTDMKSEMDKETFNSVAQDYLTSDRIYVSYPHLTPARATKLVRENDCAMREEGKDSMRIVSNRGGGVMAWRSKLSNLIEHHITRLGIDLDGCDTVVYAHPLEGTRISFTGNGRAIKQMIWSQEAVGYPLDTCLLSVNTIQEKSVEHLSVADVLPPGTKAFFIATSEYGYEITVKEILQNCQLLVERVTTTEPELEQVRVAIDSSMEYYYPGYHCAERLGITSHLFSRITSGIFVQSPHTDSDKTNIGLALKISRHNLQMVGYTRKEGNQWLYSDRAIDLVNQYMTKFPDVFEYLAININENIFFKDKMFPDEKGGERLAEVKTWLKTLEKGETRSLESELLLPPVLECLENVLTLFHQEDISIKLIRSPPTFLYLPKPELMVASPDPSAEHRLLDRIVFVRECHSIPLGAKGFIIGIEKKTKGLKGGDVTEWDEAATLYDVMFDREVVGGQALYGVKKKLVYRLNKQVFINITYGQRKCGSWQEPQHTGTLNYQNKGPSSQNYYSKVQNPLMPSYRLAPDSPNWRKPSNMNQPPTNHANDQVSSMMSSDKGLSNQNYYSKVQNPLMPPYRLAPDGLNWRKPSNMNQPPANHVNDQVSSMTSSGPTSFNVQEFFGYYSNKKNHIAGPSSTVKKEQSQHNEAVRRNQQYMEGAKQIPNEPTDSAAPELLAGMWDMLKSLQVQCKEDTGDRSEENGNRCNSGKRGKPKSYKSGKDTGGNQERILSQTFTRSVAPSKGLNDDNNTPPQLLTPSNISQPPPLLPNLHNTAPFIEDRMRGAVMHPDETSSLSALKPIKNCGHLPSCLEYLFSLCQFLNVERPVLLHKKIPLPSGEERIRSLCHFHNGNCVTGPVCHSIQQADQGVGCIGAAYLSSLYNHSNIPMRPLFDDPPPPQQSSYPRRISNRGDGCIEVNTSYRCKPEQQQMRKTVRSMDPAAASAVASTSQSSTISNTATGAGEQNQVNKRHRRPKMKIAANFQNPLV